MSTFSYKALNENGNKVTGVLDAVSIEEATSILVTRGLIPEKITSEDSSSSDSLGVKIMSLLDQVKVNDLIIFTNSSFHVAPACRY